MARGSTKDATAPRTGALWGTWDRFGRWRSPRWKTWVRTLPCVCSGAYESSAAHFRYGAQVGTGVKPDDFLVYPVAHDQHMRWHLTGQPSWLRQAEWVAEVWQRAARYGMILVPATTGLLAIAALRDARSPADFDRAVQAVRECLKSEAVLIRGPARGWIDF